MRRDDVLGTYSGAAGAWAAGPASIYRIMAGALVDACPRPLAGSRVLDFGAGTGATTAAVLGVGAAVIAADLSLDMLRENREGRPAAVVADVIALPFPSVTFDVAVGAFVISHVAAPVDTLAEVARTVRPGGVVMTLGFDRRWEYAEKERIDRAFTEAGATVAPWYRELKEVVEPMTAYPDRLLAVGRDAGLADAYVVETRIDVGVRDPDDLVAWRAGNPAYAPFLAGLDAMERAAVLRSAATGLGPDPAPLVPELLVLVGRTAS
jgi:SAM-dependent methyltransferase